MSDKKLQAKHLFFQTELNKTQISELLNISRRTLHYWIKEGNWERLKKSADHMPSIIAENCYHLLDKLTRSYLSERRLTSPATPREIDALHKLTLTINKLKGRAVLNENVEMFAYFLDKLKAQAPEVAKSIAPFIDDYLAECANMYTTDPDILPPGFTEMGYIPITTETETETEERLKDGKDLHDWDYEAYWQQQLDNLDKTEPPTETPGVIESPIDYTHSHTHTGIDGGPNVEAPEEAEQNAQQTTPFARRSFSEGGAARRSFSEGGSACTTTKDTMQCGDHELKDYLTEYLSKKEKLTKRPIKDPPPRQIQSRIAAGVAPLTLLSPAICTPIAILPQAYPLKSRLGPHAPTSPCDTCSHPTI